MLLKKYKYRDLTDERLMEYLQRGDTSAFDELYGRYSQRLLHYFFRMLGGNERKAQDFLQDAFFKIVDRPILFDTKRRFSSWIFTIAHNRCKNEYRRIHTNQIENEIDTETIPDRDHREYHYLEQSFDRGKFHEALSAELEKLDFNHRSVFVLRYQQDLPIKEISNILEVPEGTIRSRLYYTTRRLADRLKEYNPNRVEVG